MRYVLLVIIYFLMTSTALAQDVGAFGNWSAQAGLTNVMTSAVKSASKGDGKETSAPSLMVYTRDPKVSGSAKKVLIGIVEKSSPSAVGPLKQVLRENDIIGMYDKDMRPFGLSSNNVADVFAGFIIANWMIANQADRPEKKAVGAVRNNIANGMAGAVGRLKPQQRQLISEILVYQTMFAIGAYTAATNDPDKRKILSDQAQDVMKGLGVDARTYKLDETGFKPR